MVEDQEGKILVINRSKSDWPGLTFPGGHLEAHETLLDSVKREVAEETGLVIPPPHYCGYIRWVNDSKKICEIAYLFRVKGYEGTIQSSSEGEAFFISLDAVNQYPLSTDFDKVLKIMLTNR